MAKIRNNTDERKIIRAVHPNSGVTAWFHHELVSLLQAAHADAVLLIGEAYPEAPDVGIAMDRIRLAGEWRAGEEPSPDVLYFEPRLVHLSYDSTGQAIESRYEAGYWRIAHDAAPSISKIDRALKKWGDRWRGRFDKLSVTVAKKFAGRAFSSTDVSLKAALKDAGFTVAFKPTPKSLESFKLVVADNVGLIRNLQASFYSKIQQDVWASVRAGGDMASLSTKLQRSYGIETERAALIARDQNAKAKAVIETTRRQELGIRKAIWQHSSAGKVPRPTHVAMNGKTFELEKGMYDEDEKEYVFPGQLINCRCTSRAIVAGYNDEDDT